MKIRLFKSFTVLLALLGTAASFYLLYQHLFAGPDICSAIFGGSCQNALTSSWSTVLGLPLGGWGVLYYFSIGIVSLLPLLFGKVFQPVSKALLFTLSSCALAISIFLLAVMVISPALFCPLCTVVHIVNILLFLGIARVNNYRWAGFVRDLQLFFRSPWAQQIREPAFFWKLLGLLIPAFLLGSAFFSLRLISLKAEAAQKIDFASVFVNFDKEPVHEIPVNTGDAIIGDTTGKMILTVFSDFYCPGCRIFSVETDSIVQQFGGKCAIVFKQFPLDAGCNPTIAKSLHPGACAAARASLAAMQQGKFLSFHRALFEKGPGANLSALARNNELDTAAFENFRNSDAANSLLQKNIRDAEQLGIHQTPTVFLNGRQIKNIRKNLVFGVVAREVFKTTAKAVMTKQVL